MVKVLTNKQLLRNFRNIKWDTSNGSMTPSLRVGKGKTSQPVYISSQQQILLEKEYHRRRLDRMKKAKSRGNVLMHLAAKSSADGQDFTHTAASRLSALVRGFLVRQRLRKMREAAIVVQRIWTSVSPFVRAFRKHWAKVREQKIEETFLEMRMKEILSRSDGLTEVVQSHVRMFVKKIEFEDVMNARRISPLQNFVRMNKVHTNFAHIQSTATMIQSRIRQLMMRHSADQNIEQRIFKLKFHILRKYEMLLAPYTRRALFCYNTRIISQDTLRVCVRELDELKDRQKSFMELEAFRCHLTFVFKKLQAKKNDERLMSVVRSVFQPDLIFHAGDRDRMLKRAARASKQEKPNLIVSLFASRRKKREAIQRLNSALSSNADSLFSDPNHIPIKFIMKEMVKELFSSKATLHRADFGAVIMLNYVMPDIILGTVASQSEENAPETPDMTTATVRKNLIAESAHEQSDPNLLIEN